MLKLNIQGTCIILSSSRRSGVELGYPSWFRRPRDTSQSQLPPGAVVHPVQIQSLQTTYGTLYITWVKSNLILCVGNVIFLCIMENTYLNVFVCIFGTLCNTDNYLHVLDRSCQYLSNKHLRNSVCAEVNCVYLQ